MKVHQMRAEKIMSTSAKISTTRSSKSLKTLYLILAIAGSIAPWLWLLQDPAALLSPTLFFHRSFANPIANALTSDLVISSIVFFCFAAIELKRLGSSSMWVLFYIGLTFGIGLSCALPLFGYHREQILERNALS
jgi:Terpene cyclase DEP1